MAKVLNGELSTKGHMTLEEQRVHMRKILAYGKALGLDQSVPLETSRTEWRDKVESSMPHPEGLL